jgi:lysophospholipase L1-like esterase
MTYSASPAAGLLSANNLSDVQNKPAALANLGANGTYLSKARGFELEFKGLPLVMSAPPTITVTNNTATPTTTMGTVRTLPGTSYTSILTNDFTKYTPLGVGAASVNTATGTGISGFETQWVIGAFCPGGHDIESLWDGSICEIVVRQFAGAQYRLLVDGQYVTAATQSVGGTPGQYASIKIDFAGVRRPRRLTLETTGGSGGHFVGVYLQVTDTWRATAKPSRRLVIAGDSYAGGATSSSVGSFGGYMARALGFRDFINAGVGGAGWIATNGGANDMASRLTADVINNAPTDVVFALGHNDTSFTNAAIQAKVTAVLTSTRAALPNLKSLTVVGPLFAGGGPGVYTAMSVAMQAGAAGLADAYIDTTTSPIFTGTGRVGATTGDGNSDLNISGVDGVHPTDAGSLWLGTSLAQAIYTGLVKAAA